MTVSYAKYGGSFGRILLRWRGSIWKSLWHELVVYLLLYTTISMVYRFGLGPEGQAIFEKIAYQFRDYTKSIPLTFLLGFYVGLVVKRWWDQFHYLPWPDTVMLWVSSYFRGEENERNRRRIARYLILTTTLAFRSLSVRVYKRFPTLDHVQRAGLMTDAERKYNAAFGRKQPLSSDLLTYDLMVSFVLRQYDSVQLKFQRHHDRWILPLNWILTIAMQHIRTETEEELSSVEMKQLVESLENYRSGLEHLFIYDWICVPLVYTQVVTIATYGYFSLCLISNQYLSSKTKNELDLYVPFFTILQFLFYVGWLRVAEDLIMPFGEDDEDFEMNYILDRHTEMAFLLANIHSQLPPWQPTVFDTPMLTFAGFPDTVASEQLGPDNEPECHVHGIAVSPLEQAYAGVKETNASRAKATYAHFSPGAIFGKERTIVNCHECAADGIQLYKCKQSYT